MGEQIQQLENGLPKKKPVITKGKSANNTSSPNA
jgi:hypothetical protein